MLFFVALFVGLFILGTNYNSVKTKFMTQYKTSLLNPNINNEQKKNDEYTSIA